MSFRQTNVRYDGNQKQGNIEPDGKDQSTYVHKFFNIAQK